MREETRRAVALLFVLGVLLSLSACVQRAETKKLPAAPEATQLSSEDVSSIESDLNEAEQMLADIGLEEQIDVTPATEL